MIKLHWTSKAASDLVRLYEFLAPLNKQVAAQVVQSLSKAPNNLQNHPRLGERLEAFDPREVRRIVIGDYEMRYEIQREAVYILRIWHTREHR